MYKSRDLNTVYRTQALGLGKDQFGYSIVQYEVRRYTDLRNFSNGTRSYLVTMTQRVVIPSSSYREGASTEGWLTYPVLMRMSAKVDQNENIDSCTLLSYYPKTVNSAVSTSQDGASGTEGTSSREYTSGSSTSQTNSFSISAGIGAWGKAATGDLSGSYEHSTTQEQMNSNTYGNAFEVSGSLSNSSEMTIKDWGAYAVLNDDSFAVKWNFAQAYPWNALEFPKVADGSDPTVTLPDYVQARLWDGVSILYPPSELSLFGVDFVSQATWQLVPDALTAGSVGLSLTHKIVLETGSHQITNSALDVQISQGGAYEWSSRSLDRTAEDQSFGLDLALVALEPLFVSRSSSVVALLDGTLDVPPLHDDQMFETCSKENSVLVRGSGFNESMVCELSKISKASIQISVKLLDGPDSATLFLKHWLTVDARWAVRMDITVNGVTIPSRFLDVTEDGSGGDNVTSIILRNQDLSSSDYCDYLLPGPNLILISYAPVSLDGSEAPPADVGYCISAIGIS